MNEKFIKNIDPKTVLEMDQLVSYQQGQVVSKTFAQNKYVSLTLFAFDKDEEISSHDSSGDAMVLCLDGQGEITIDGEKFILSKGETIVMPAKIPHAVYAKEQFKMLLIVIFKSE